MKKKRQKKPDAGRPLRAKIFGTNDRRLIYAVRRLIDDLSPTIATRLQSGTVNIIFTNKRYMTELNQRYLSRNRPTDVLTFSLDLPQESPGQNLLGEIYICREQAQQQAKTAGKKLHGELLFLVRHGLLHLAGFSHQEMNRLP